MSQDSIVIFRSYIDAIAELPAELYKEVSRVLYAYAFDGIEPGDEASPTARALFIALKSQIDFSVARYERAVRNGSKGGAPKGARNNPNGRRGKRTNQELTETNQELTNPEKLVISDVSGVEAVEILPEGEEENTPNLPKIRRKGFVKTNQELTQNKPRTNQDGETELTDAKELTLISNQLSINNSVVVDSAREVSFLERFFAPENQYSLDVLCMQNSTDVETLKQYANEIIAEWQLRGVKHTDYKDAAQHLINHLRRKFEADRRRAREDAATPKSRRQARQDLMQGAAERMARAIKSDGSAASPSTAGDTEPF